MVCEPGRQLDCACAGGGSGAQACRSDGSGFAACTCTKDGGGSSTADIGLMDAAATSDVPDASRGLSLDLGLDTSPTDVSMEPPGPVVPDCAQLQMEHPAYCDAATGDLVAYSPSPDGTCQLVGQCDMRRRHMCFDNNPDPALSTMSEVQTAHFGCIAALPPDQQCNDGCHRDHCDVIMDPVENCAAGCDVPPGTSCFNGCLDVICKP